MLYLFFVFSIISGFFVEPACGKLDIALTIWLVQVVRQCVALKSVCPDFDFETYFISAWYK